jgi:septin family protein
MWGLSKRVVLLPVVGKADAMTAEEAADCCRAVQHMLAEPAEYVPGISGGASIDVHK